MSRSRSTFALIFSTTLGLVGSLSSSAGEVDASGPILFPRGAQFDDDFLATSAIDLDGRILLQDGEARSLSVYTVPIEIEYCVKSDGANARFGFACYQVLFDWETNPSQLRVDGGKVNGRHVDGMGRLPTDRFCTVRQVVLEDRMDVYVDGELRGRWDADFRDVKMPIRVWTTDWATLIVDSIRIRPAAPITSAPPVVAKPKDGAGFFPRSTKLDDDFVSVRGLSLGGGDGGVLLRDGVLESLGQHAVPLEITYRVKTDSTNVRLGYGAWEIIFNWEMNPDELRIGLGPAGGQHVRNKGRIPVGEFVTIRQVVRENGMAIYVNDELRGAWKADYRGYRAPVKVFTRDATLTVDSIKIQPTLPW